MVRQAHVEVALADSVHTRELVVDFQSSLLKTIDCKPDKAFESSFVSVILPARRSDKRCTVVSAESCLKFELGLVACRYPVFEEVFDLQD